MRFRLARLFVASVASLGMLACGASNTTETPGQAVAVAVVPGSASVNTGASYQFQAAVTGTANLAVTWSVQEGSPGSGTVSGGLYAAPSTGGVFHVVATSVADATKSGSATVTVAAPVVAVTVSPKTSTVAAGGTATFSATVTGTSNPSVTWSVQEGSPGGGTVSGGVYTAPSTAGTYHVVATSVADGTKKDTATVTVTSGGSTTRMQQLQYLATKAGYFGHKSTGECILDGQGSGRGVQGLINANSGSGFAVKGDSGVAPRYGSRDPGDVVNGVLLNDLIGDNGYPLTKTADFDSILKNGVGAKLNSLGGYAIMKWCFVDFGAGQSTSPSAAFNDYKTHLHAWKAAWPNIRFLHSTVPITYYNTEADNPNREAMSNLLRNDPEIISDGLFDLADWECKNATGQCILDSAGNRMLRPEYTSDNVHPDTNQGYDWLGGKLIDFLYDRTR